VPVKLYFNLKIIIPINTPVTIKINLKGPRPGLVITSIEDQKVIRFEYNQKNIGMTKNGVRAALGYPATHRTPSLENQTWIYWTNRFQNYYVRFDKNGKVKISGNIEKRLRDIEDRLDAIEKSK
jgi:outer membrane protein assembly factor BamE (lipoprotein component of BamABCDE complex)